MRAVSFTGVRAMAAEGARIGIITCERCGAAILIDGADSVDFPARHAEWHEAIEVDTP